MAKRGSSPNPSRRTGMVIFALISLTFLAAGYWHLRTETKLIRQEKSRNLAAIGELKVSQIVQWRKERLDDAYNLAGSPFFRKTVEEWLRNPGNLLLQQGILKRLQLTRDVYGYANVLLFGPDGRILLSANEELEPVENTTRRTMEIAVAEGRAVLSDLYFRSSGLVYLESVVPILDDGGVSIGILLLRCDAQAFLYPLLQSWPMTSRSAETLLVRQEGEDVLFLNNLRFKTDAAFSLRFPLAQADLPEVQALLGKKGVVEGKDYRSVKVLADLHPVPSSPWFMVSKVDSSEILAEGRYRFIFTTLLVAILILLAAVAISLVYRRRQALLYRALYQSEQEHRQAQEELLKSEERYRNTLDDMMEGFQIIGYDWRYLYVNKAVVRHAGRTRKQLLGKTMMECYPEIEKTEMFSVLQRSMKERTSHRMEDEFTFPDGSERWFKLSIQPVPEGILVLSEDITERKLSKEALQKSEEKYRILHEFAGEAIFTYSADLKIMEVNKTACEYIGESREEILGRDIFELGILHPDDISLSVGNIQKILSREKALVVDKVRFKGKHGLYGTFQVTSTAVFRDGEIVAITNVCRDVTLEEQLYSALEASEKRYKYLFNAGNDAVFVYGFEEKEKPGKFVEVNDLACTLTGYSRNELFQLTSVDLTVPEEKEHVYEFNRILSEKKHQVFERTFLTKDKRRIPTEISSHSFLLNDEPTVLSIVRDITERKKREESLRTALKEKESILQETHSRVKNNLQIMSSLLRLQACQISDKKAQMALTESQTRIHSMALIHEKLYQSEDFSSIDLADYIEKMVTYLFAVYEANARQIRFKMDMHPIEMEISRAIPCGLIINELVSNALNHAFPRSKKGELTVRIFKDRGGKCHLIVKDTGCGIPEKIDIQTPQTLGLQIVTDLVKQLEGKLKLRRDGGTEFEITF